MIEDADHRCLFRFRKAELVGANQFPYDDASSLTFSTSPSSLSSCKNEWT